MPKAIFYLLKGDDIYRVCIICVYCTHISMYWGSGLRVPKIRGPFYSWGNPNKNKQHLGSGLWNV